MYQVIEILTFPKAPENGARPIIHYLGDSEFDAFSNGADLIDHMERQGWRVIGESDVISDSTWVIMRRNNAYSTIWVIKIN